MRMRIATSFAARMRGLLGVMPGNELAEGVLVLAPCRSVHTVGMAFALDIAFVSSEGRVLASQRQVPPGRFLKRRGAAAVLERRSCKCPWYEPGEFVSLAVPEEPVGLTALEGLQSMMKEGK